MSFTSQAGYVGIKTQAVAGTYSSPGSGGIFTKITGGALAGSRDFLTPDPEIGGGRDVNDGYLGSVKFDGEYDSYPRWDSFATLLRAAMGDLVQDVALAGADTGAFRHDLALIDSGSLPLLSIEENIGDGLDHFRYWDAKVDKVSISVDANGYFTAKTSIIAIHGEAVPSASATLVTSADWDNGPLVVGSNVGVSFGGVTLPAKSLTFEIANNLDSGDFRLGSLFLGDLTEKRRDVTVQVKIRPQDNSLWRQALYGDPSAVDVHTGVVTKGAVAINAHTYEKIVGGGAQTYGMDLAAPVALIQPFKLNPQKDDVIEDDITIQFVRPDPATGLFTAQVFNKRATVL